MVRQTHTASLRRQCSAAAARVTNTNYVISIIARESCDTHIGVLAGATVVAKQVHVAARINFRVEQTGLQQRSGDASIGKNFQHGVTVLAGQRSFGIVVQVSVSVRGVYEKNSNRIQRYCRVRREISKVIHALRPCGAAKVRCHSHRRLQGAESKYKRVQNFNSLLQR